MTFRDASPVNREVTGLEITETSLSSDSSGSDSAHLKASGEKAIDETELTPKLTISDEAFHERYEALPDGSSLTPSQTEALRQLHLAGGSVAEPELEKILVEQPKPKLTFAGYKNLVKKLVERGFVVVDEENKIIILTELATQYLIDFTTCYGDLPRPGEKEVIHTNSIRGEVLEVLADSIRRQYGKDTELHTQWLYPPGNSQRDVLSLLRQSMRDGADVGSALNLLSEGDGPILKTQSMSDENNQKITNVRFTKAGVHHFNRLQRKIREKSAKEVEVAKRRLEAFDMAETCITLASDLDETDIEQALRAAAAEKHVFRMSEEEFNNYASAVAEIFEYLTTQTIRQDISDMLLTCIELSAELGRDEEIDRLSTLFDSDSLAKISLIELEEYLQLIASELTRLRCDYVEFKRSLTLSK